MKLNLPPPQAFPRLSGGKGPWGRANKVCMYVCMYVKGTGDKREARVGDDGNDGRAPLRPSFPLEQAIFTLKTFDYNYQNSFRFCFLI